SQLHGGPATRRQCAFPNRDGTKDAVCGPRLVVVSRAGRCELFGNRATVLHSPQVASWRAPAVANGAASRTPRNTTLLQKSAAGTTAITAVNDRKVAAD